MAEPTINAISVLAKDFPSEGLLRTTIENMTADSIAAHDHEDEEGTVSCPNCEFIIEARHSQLLRDYARYHFLVAQQLGVDGPFIFAFDMFHLGLQIGRQQEADARSTAELEKLVSGEAAQ